MDVKDIKRKIEVEDAKAANTAKQQRLASSIPSIKIKTAPEESVRVNVRSSAGHADTRVRLNEVINAVHSVSEATTSMRQLVDSIGGIVEIAQTNPSPQRKEALEKEANGLVDAIKQKAMGVKVGNAHPLAGDPIRLQVEARIGKSLEIIFPEGAAGGFGIGQISLSKKDVIIDTQTRLERARQELDKLKDAVAKGSDELKGTVSVIEVALENSESAQASVRDVDKASDLAKETSLNIGKDPHMALAASQVEKAPSAKVFLN